MLKSEDDGWLPSSCKTNYSYFKDMKTLVFYKGDATLIGCSTHVLIIRRYCTGSVRVSSYALKTHTLQILVATCYNKLFRSSHHISSDSQDAILKKRSSFLALLQFLTTKPLLQKLVTSIVHSRQPVRRHQNNLSKHGKFSWKEVFLRFLLFIFLQWSLSLS